MRCRNRWSSGSSLRIRSASVGGALTLLAFATFVAGCGARRTIASAGPPEPDSRHAAYNTEVRVDLDGAALDVRFTFSYVASERTARKIGLLSTFDQEMIGDLRITLPPDWEVVASGSVAFEKGVHVIRNRVPQVDVAFVAAPSFERIQSERFTVYYREADPRAASAVLAAAENCARYLNSRYGARDPIPKGRLVLADRPGPGYARKNYIVLSRMDAVDAEGLHYFLCHELAHYWTRSAGAFSPHHWMTETFAEYVAGRYLREHFGQLAFDRRRAQWEELGRAHGPVWTPASTKRPSFFVMYRRAPYLLSRLEERIGAERFDRFLERYMIDRVRTTPELLEQLEIIAGAETAQWFRAQLADGPVEVR